MTRAFACIGSSMVFLIKSCGVLSNYSSSLTSVSNDFTRIRTVLKTELFQFHSKNRDDAAESHNTTYFSKTTITNNRAELATLYIKL